MEFINRIKCIKKLELFVVCMRFISIVLICIICAMVTLLSIGALIKGLNGVLGIDLPQWISIIGTVVSGLFGVIGGIYASKHEIMYKEKADIENVINIIDTILKSEIKINGEILAHNKYNKDDEFEISQWEKIKYEIIKLERVSKFNRLAMKICDLYKWLEYANKLMDIEPNIVKDSKIRLYNKISMSMQDVLLEINSVGKYE